MLASLIAGFASGEAVLAVRRAKQAAIAYLFAGLAMACGVGFLIGAAYIWTAERYGSVEAAAGFGGFFVLVSLIIVAAHRLRARSRARLIAQKRSADVKALTVTAAVAALPSLLRGKAGIGALLVPAAAVAGYALYRRSRTPDPDLPSD
jgi:hypothetical protein